MLERERGRVCFFWPAPFFLFLPWLILLQVLVRRIYTFNCTVYKVGDKTMCVYVSVCLCQAPTEYLVKRLHNVRGLEQTSFPCTKGRSTNNTLAKLCLLGAERSIRFGAKHRPVPSRGANESGPNYSYTGKGGTTYAVGIKPRCQHPHLTSA